MTTRGGTGKRRVSGFRGGGVLKCIYLCGDHQMGGPSEALISFVHSHLFLGSTFLQWGSLLFPEGLMLRDGKCAK